MAMNGGGFADSIVDPCTGHVSFDVSHNTSLKSLQLCAYISLRSRHEVTPSDSTETLALYQWLTLSEELRADLSTVRSTQLQRLTVHVRVALVGFMSSDDVSLHGHIHSPSAKRLHEVMRRPFFDTLKHVKIVLEVVYTHWQGGSYVSWAIEPGVRQLFEPWVNRTIVQFSQTLKHIEGGADPR